MDKVFYNAGIVSPERQSYDRVNGPLQNGGVDSTAEDQYHGPAIPDTGTDIEALEQLASTEEMSDREARGKYKRGGSFVDAHQPDKDWEARLRRAERDREGGIGF